MKNKITYPPVTEEGWTLGVYSPLPPEYRHRRHKRYSLRIFLAWLFLVTALTAGLTAWIAYQDITADLPLLERLANYALLAATRVYADDGTLIGEFFLEKRYPVSLEHIPLLVRAAFIAAEDAHFYTHPGINPISMVRVFSLTGLPAGWYRVQAQSPSRWCVISCSIRKKAIAASCRRWSWRSGLKGSPAGTRFSLCTYSGLHLSEKR